MMPRANQKTIAASAAKHKTSAEYRRRQFRWITDWVKAGPKEREGNGDPFPSLIEIVEQAHGHAGPVTTPLTLSKDQLIPAQFVCVALRTNVFAPTAASIPVRSALWLYPEGVPLVSAPALYDRFSAK